LEITSRINQTLHFKLEYGNTDKKYGFKLILQKSREIEGLKEGNDGYKRKKIQKGHFINRLLTELKTKGTNRHYIPLLLAYIYESPTKQKSYLSDLYENELGHLNLNYQDIANITKTETDIYVATLNKEVQLQKITNPFENREHFTLEKWLNPANHPFLPFIGRKKELQLLDDFSNHPDTFKIWAIVASSGAGKTRLCNHWSTTSDIVKNWYHMRLQLDNRIWMNPEFWWQWQPEKPTLIIIDYMFGFAEVIQAISQSRAQLSNNHTVRLLVLDHTFPKDLQNLRDDLSWSPTGISGSRNLKMGNFFFKKEPLNLTASDDQDEILHQTICYLAGENTDEESINAANDYLYGLKNQGAWHPLFAAFIGEALRENKDYQRWSRSDLIASYLQGSDRMPWENSTVQGAELAGYFIATATAKRGADYAALKTCIPKNVPRDLKAIRNICGRVISQDFTEELPPFEPDILGENFFLWFLGYLFDEDAEHSIQPFAHMLEKGDKETQAEDALAFVGFIERLVRNLSNDDQENEVVKKHWKSLLKFLDPEFFDNNAQMRWAVSVALVKISDDVKLYQPFSQYENLLDKVDDSSFYQVQAAVNPNLSIACALKYNNACLEEYSDEHDIEPFRQYCSNNNFSPLDLCIEQSLLFIAEYIIKYTDKMHKADRFGFTPLMKACTKNKKTFVRMFINNHVKLEQTNFQGFTALCWACNSGHKTIAEILIVAGAKIEHFNSSGHTPLMIASQLNHVDVVKLLLANGADIEKRDIDNHTALAWACFYNQTETVKLLLDEGARTDWVDYYGCTALGLAKNQKHNETIGLLNNYGVYQ